MVFMPRMGASHLAWLRVANNRQTAMPERIARMERLDLRIIYALYPDPCMITESIPAMKRSLQVHLLAESYIDDRPAR